MEIKTYQFLMGASAFVITILGSMLATATILPEDGLKKLRKARNILMPSCFRISISQFGVLPYGIFLKM